MGVIQEIIGGVVVFFIILFSAPSEMRKEIKEKVEYEIYESNETSELKKIYKGDKIIRYRNPNY
ncbi:MAG: hypothetical protein QM490_01885 [Candidatus Gracilibacteria bacterium]